MAQLLTRKIFKKIKKIRLELELDFLFI